MNGFVRQNMLWGLLLLFIAGVMAWYVYASWTEPSEESLRLQIYAIPAQFRARHQPRVLLHVDKLLAGYPDALQQPSSILPQLHRYPYQDVKALLHYQKTCRISWLPKILSPSLRKAVTWQSFLCDKTKHLPSSFFEQPPYIQPFGHSYVYRAWKSRHTPFRGKLWLRQHWNKLHLLELAEIDAKALELSASWQVIRSLGWQGLGGLWQRQPVIVTPSVVLLREVSTTPTSPQVYAVFLRETFTRFLRHHNLSIQVGTPDSTTTCLAWQGSLCWQAIKRVSSRWGVWLGLVLLLCCLGLLTNMILIQTRRFVERQRLQERHALMIQTLTHELRTPTTALQLAIETLRREYEALPEQSQIAFLRMCQDIQKLKRVIHASQQYLQSNLDGHAVALQIVEIASIHQFVQGIVSEWQEEKGVSAQLQSVSQDCAIRLDRYWFKVCLHNLLDNAYQHGIPPILVSLEPGPRYLRVAVQDQGQSTLDLEELIQPFAKSHHSDGLGLGLGIVAHLAREMGGSLTVTSNPTTFSLTLERKS